MTEIDRGWITAAPTLEQLGARIGLDPPSLVSTVGLYNAACADGTDREFGRPSDTLLPLANSPFYAIKLWPTLLNTQGGPRHNARAEVLNTRGQPISGLYCAGELGSLWNRIYPGGGNITEALACGRIAGRNAAAQAPRRGVGSRCPDDVCMAPWTSAGTATSLRSGQYASEHFQRVWAEQGIECSMIRAGEVWDNLAMERFFSSLKTERTARKV